MDIVAAFWVAALVTWLACGAFTGYLAQQKGRSGVWYLWGLLFGLLALIAAAGLPVRTASPSVGPHRPPEPNDYIGRRVQARQRETTDTPTAHAKHDTAEPPSMRPF